jgi:hypothetical protein
MFVFIPSGFILLVFAAPRDNAVSSLTSSSLDGELSGGFELPVVAWLLGRLSS